MAGKELETLQQLATKKMQEAEHGVAMVFDVEGDEGGLEAWAEDMMKTGLLFEAHMKDVERVKKLDKGCMQPLQLPCRLRQVLLAEDSAVLEEPRVQGRAHGGIHTCS